jgi:predicted Zn-dependent protease
MPPTLAQWHDPDHQGDYLDAVQPTPVGSLVWSQFPIRVYVEPARLSANASDRAQVWVDAVTQAVEEWARYLPLTYVDSPDTADITIWRRTPPIQWDRSPDASQPSEQPSGPGSNRLPRARSADAHYQLFVDRPANAAATLSHRFEIQLSPNQTGDYTKATARHEIGHALGIWGHSTLPTDALYFSQVRNPAPISVRDVNTLKRVYEQPTRLGWAIVEAKEIKPGAQPDISPISSAILDRTLSK